MTADLPATDTSTSSRDDFAPVRTPAARAIDFAPGIVVVVVVVAGLLANQTPLWDIVRYALYLVLTVLLPGTLVHRALRGRSPMMLVDLALGAATGTALGLAAWAVFMVIGIQQVLWLWPLAVFIPFAAVPALRRHWTLGGYTERSPVTSWLLSAALLVYSLTLLVSMRVNPLPPHANLYYFDVYWHLSNAAELTHRLPPDVPSVAGRTLRYHWFSNADMAHANLISGVDLPTIILRLWPIPIVAIILGLVLALSRRVADASWPAGVAALFIVLPGELMPWEWVRPVSPYPLSGGSSPSQVFGLIPLFLAAMVLVDVVRKERIGNGWWVLVLAVALAPGSKPSVLPILLCGMGLVLLVNLIRREPVLRVVAAMALMVFGIIGFWPLVAQATAASGVKLFGLLAFHKTWTDYVPKGEMPSTGGHVIAGLGDPSALFLAVALVAWTVLQLGYVLAGVSLVRKPTRMDPAALLLAGAVVGGIAATLLLDHAAAAEIYFERTAVPLGAVLATWGLYVGLAQAHRLIGIRRTLGVVVAGLVTGLLILVGVDLAAHGGQPAVADYPEKIGFPLGVLAVLTIVAFVLWWVLRRFAVPSLKGAGLAFFGVAVSALFLVHGTQDGWNVAGSAVRHDAVVLPSTKVTAAETKAALWVEKHTPRDDILATNVHCRFRASMNVCDSRAYWVTAFSERRALVESWAYTEENLKRIGQFTVGFPLFPFDDPTLLKENDRNFTNPTAASLAALREKHHVRWLFADSRAGKVSPRLDNLATLRFSAGSAKVYELK